MRLRRDSATAGAGPAFAAALGDSSPTTGLDRPSRPAPALLIGPERDLEFVRTHLTGSAIQGTALLLTGEAGIGKTALLDVVAAQARPEDTRVLRVNGVQFETDGPPCPTPRTLSGWRTPARGVPERPVR
ncbi:hypothetical protein ACFY6U_05940 [Streptomyces sp. NPDC013157]|uniref:hypothetical protein n=1 Tax=Streptomyces sp. NPDC013157 TaxID=3364861 RepID=UPI00369BBF7D